MKKKNIMKIFLTSLLVFIGILLVGFNDVDANVTYIKTNYVDGTNGLTYIINSNEELKQLINDNAIVEKYDDEYFGERQLVLIIISVPSVDISISVTNYKIVDSVLNVEMKKYSPIYSKMLMANYNILIEVEDVEIKEVKYNLK